MTIHVDDRQILRRHRIAEAMQSASSSRTLRGCVGQDSNLGTPSGRDLESLAFDRAWLPTRGRAATAVRKTFPVSIATGGHQPRLFPVGLLRGGNGASMVQYFTKAFFDELAGRLNADAEWGKKAAAIVAKIVLTCTDRNASFLLDIQNGRVAVHDVAPDVPADFKFEGTYEAWTQLGKGEKDFQGLVLGGRIRFRGSMPKVMALMGPLSRITQIAQQIPREF